MKTKKKIIKRKREKKNNEKKKQGNNLIDYALNTSHSTKGRGNSHGKHA